MKVRRVQFRFEEEIPLHYMRNNIFSTHLVNSFHVLFPEAERFFIRSLQNVAPTITDAKLQQQMKDFCGQEGTHAHQHLKFWKALRKQGFDIDGFAKFYRRFCYDEVERTVYQLYGEEEGAKVCLAVTAALEHYTSMLAEIIFEYKDNWEALPDNMKHLLYWHAAEEIEHKSVAYDILHHIDDRYELKVKGMLIATALMWSFTFVGMSMFIWQDPQKPWRKMPTMLIDFIGTLGHPAVKKLNQQWAKFFSKDFHPEEMKNRHYAEEYFAQYSTQYESGAMF
jgi:uncharacterized protein